MAKKKSAGSSQPERLIRRSEADIRAYAKSDATKEASKRLREHIRKHGLDPSPEDLKEIPALTDEELDRMYRPVKKPVTVRLDADVIAWLKAKGDRYQTHMNAMLRDAMHREMRAGRKR
jgi:uncharacterized protein (DUF4415 family)